MQAVTVRRTHEQAFGLNQEAPRRGDRPLSPRFSARRRFAGTPRRSSSSRYGEGWFLRARYALSMSGASIAWRSASTNDWISDVRNSYSGRRPATGRPGGPGRRQAGPARRLLPLPAFVDLVNLQGGRQTEEMPGLVLDAAVRSGAGPRRLGRPPSGCRPQSGSGPPPPSAMAFSRSVDARAAASRYARAARPKSFREYS